LKWNASGGGFTDNDADPDFFVFEDLGNDSVVVHAILGDGTLGAGVALSGWNVVRTDGVLNGGEFTGRSVAGVAFDFTDLLDATGANLTNGTTIQGIVLGDASDADFYEVYANVDTGPDTTAPSWTLTYPQADTPTAEGFTLRAALDEPGTAYYVVVVDGATAPTAEEVKAGIGSGGSGELTSGSITLTAAETEHTTAISGLTDSTAYDVWFVAEDDESPTPNLQASTVKVDITTEAPDTTPPSWTATYPQANTPTPDGFTARAAINEPGTAYYVVVADGAAAPSSAEVKAGTGSGGSGELAGGSIPLTAADTENTATITGLAVDSPYDVYFVAEDDETSPNLQASPAKVDITTETPFITNGGFESTPFDVGWTASGVTSTTGLDGSATAAHLPFNTSATLGQAFSAQTDFTVDFMVSVAGSSTNDSFHVYLDTAGGNAIELRGALGNILQVNGGGSYESLTRISDGTTFGFGADVEMMIRIIGRSFGTASAEYDVAWSDPAGTTLVHAATGLTTFASASAPAGGAITGIRFDRTTTSGHSYTIDNVVLLETAETAPVADYELVVAPPNTDKVVEISGVYPHLTMTNSHGECGPGAIAPWAGDLWVVTYAPHEPDGSTDKLYQIKPDLTRVIRPESVGGTPANRMIHNESNQLFIGHHAIAADGTVRTIPVASMPGRLTGSARHLTDPSNKIYHATMEEGFYEVDVNTLAVTTLYVDNQYPGTPKANLPGVHGKGLFTSQGKLYYTNNGGGGTLAAWDGSSWTAVQNDNFTELTGPGGIRGNTPSDDRLWAVGWDGRSLILKVLEGGTWTDFRLPKSSYTHDADPGWFTEWPRIRQLDPDTPGSPYLMHMHGMFFDFPGTFSAVDFSGLRPLCSYHKMPVDYCTFEGRLVMTKNDLSKFSNALAPRAQSNLWFGQIEDLSDWGAPQGHGGVWVNESVSAAEVSDPFLVNGFSRITLHLRNGGGSAVPVAIESSDGSGTWSAVTTVNVPANGYTFEILNDLPAEWLRLTANVAASNLSGYFILSNPYPHSPIASVGTDRFAALADIRDTGGHSDGLIRPMSGSDLQLEFASNDGGYHRIGGALELQDVTNGSAEASLRSQGALSQDFGSDAASAWIDDGGTRFRLPKLDPLYDAPFLSGWARGFREVVTERELLNVHGTFYEIPRDNSGGKRRMRPLATHGKRITDFTSWRGLLVLSGVLDDAPASDALVRSPSGAALWLGEVDDIWKMGEPRGTGGPWRDTAVTAGTPSDPYLMYGYDRKELTLSVADAATITVEVDFLADNTWSTYQSFSLSAGETLNHLFPDGFHSHWVRVTSSASTTATAQFTYGPAPQRDALLDWAREEGLPTAGGRAAVAAANGDGDDLDDLAEFVFGTNPALPNPWPLSAGPSGMNVILRDLDPADGFIVEFESCDDLQSWLPRNELAAPAADQSGASPGFTRWTFAWPEDERHFVRVRIRIP
ncbi:hypothetical protein, partial [Haloferula sp. A504]|uniref:hypothetical protein n=1 Tax=Haloferula sp. A504 TaxID=3373601 RepID=UPI0031BDA258|nr:hypothetical protein [Verrucomicrobiaceae bacterium E54]